MKIDLLCTDSRHPINHFLKKWLQSYRADDLQLFNKKEDLIGGDLLFLLSCSEKMGRDVLDKYKECVVIHASDLPEGKGWSPHVWAILQGKSELTVSAISCAEKIDAGDVWAKKEIEILNSDLYHEINAKLFQAEIDSIIKVIEMVQNKQKPTPQREGPSSYFPKRTAKDSKLDISKSLEEQFNLLRVCDPDRYPAFFEINGQTYEIFIRKRANDN